MIRYSMQCDKKHEFEVWFRNSADYDRQAKRKLVSCPRCGSANVKKALMAPALSRAAKRGEPAAAASAGHVPTPEGRTPVAMISPEEREFRTKLKELRDHLVRNAENVGPRFPEEARKMHYGETEHRSIYGEASPQEAKEMLEEGIQFHPLPILPDEQN